jgi:hypothetical protein
MPVLLLDLAFQRGVIFSPRSRNVRKKIITRALDNGLKGKEIYGDELLDLKLSVKRTDTIWKDPTIGDEVSSRLRKEPLGPKAFSKALIKEMAFPDEWTRFTNVYDSMIRNNRNLKRKKPQRFLAKCNNYIELDIDGEGYAIIRRRQE